MMSYRDMTFCPFEDCDNFTRCDRALTEEIVRQAVEWWGDADAPISEYAALPPCFSNWNSIL